MVTALETNDHVVEQASNGTKGISTIDKPMSIERGAHADVREGVQAFLDKRKPAFPGKVSADMPSQYPWWRADRK